MAVGGSWYVRSRKSRCCEGSLVVTPEFQGRGVGREMVRVETSIETQLGYTTMINDHAASNERMRRLIRRLYGRRSVVVGCLPRGLYTAGVGWDDQIITYLDIQHCPTFSEIAEHSRAPHCSVSKL